LDKAKEEFIEYPTLYKSVNDPKLLDRIFSDWISSKIFAKCKGAPIIYMNQEEKIIFLEKGKIEIQKNEDLLKESLIDFDLLDNSFSTWQIILSRSIAPNRIIKIVTNQDEFGKILHKNRKYNYSEDY